MSSTSERAAQEEKNDVLENISQCAHATLSLVASLCRDPKTGGILAPDVIATLGVLMGEATTSASKNFQTRLNLKGADDRAGRGAFIAAFLKDFDKNVKEALNCKAAAYPDLSRILEHAKSASKEANFPLIMKPPFSIPPDHAAAILRRDFMYLIAGHSLDSNACGPVCATAALSFIVSLKDQANPVVIHELALRSASLAAFRRPLNVRYTEQEAFFLSPRIQEAAQMVLESVLFHHSALVRRNGFSAPDVAATLGILTGSTLHEALKTATPAPRFDPPRHDGTAQGIFNAHPSHTVLEAVYDALRFGYKLKNPENPANEKTKKGFKIKARVRRDQKGFPVDIKLVCKTKGRFPSYKNLVHSIANEVEETEDGGFLIPLDISGTQNIPQIEAIASQDTLRSVVENYGLDPMETTSACAHAAGRFFADMNRYSGASPIDSLFLNFMKSAIASAQTGVLPVDDIMNTQDIDPSPLRDLIHGVLKKTGGYTPHGLC